ncbi:MAG: Divalent ion tolerance protein CutA1 [Cenarchaeum symbiont of Oopsacas minuta]|nr:Divalent ion tolerance protein CutA1 [Cenarchaeum symbiont of Oopsacas minuta]
MNKKRVPINKSNTMPIILISTYPTKKIITNIANNTVKLKLAACVNMIRISSIYSWENNVKHGSEYLALFKTTSKNKKKLVNHIQKTHPYKVPEIAKIDISSVNIPYMKWITESVL